MEEIAKVIKVNRDTLTARIERHSACGKCGMCGLTPDSKYIDILFKNTVEAKVGDSVVISVSGENITKFTLLVYLLPLVVGFILFAIGFWALALPDWASILVFLAG
ncbi:MAG: SoxR reducing system RseC family protein, partial [Clostridia bacterium]